MLLTLLGCLAPAMHAAHSLDAGQVEFGLGAQVPFTSASVDFAAAHGDYTAEQFGFSAPDIGDVAPEFRIGLGAGFEVASRGIPFIGVTQVKYSLLDERRHKTPLSIAFAAEVNPDVYGGEGYGARGGVLFSSTALVSDQVALRPGVGAWYGWVGSAYHFDLPEGAKDQRNGEAPSLFLSYRNTGLMVPVGLEIPVHAGSFAITPYLSATFLFPLSRTLVDADTVNSTGVITAFDAPFTAIGQAGVRVAPWFVPARSQQ